MQHVATGIPVHKGRDVLTLERGDLAKIDRQLLSELNHGTRVKRLQRLIGSDGGVDREWRSTILARSS